MCKKLTPLILLVLILGQGCAEQQATKKSKHAYEMKTYVYEVVGDCQIKADVYGGKSTGTQRPVVLFIHGGALINGTRQGAGKGVKERFIDEGFVLVSIDYRLAPETKVTGIIEDVQDAYRGVREDGPELFGADPDRIGVVGGSAGGYLTLMTGFCVQPRPKALLVYCGYGDISGDWLSRPDPFHSISSPVSKQQAYNGVGGRVITGVTDDAQKKRRGRFYLYCRQQGLWPKEITGHDPHTEPEAFKPYCPIRNVTPDYPPVILIHGDKDTDVPHEQSIQMAAELARVGVEHEFITLKGAGHGSKLKTANPEAFAKAFDKAVAFFKRHVKNTKN